MADDDAVWNEAAREHDWELPFKAAWPLRLPIVRHVRGYWHAFRMNRMVSQFASVGIGVGVPQEYDLWVLHAIFRGWC